MFHWLPGTLGALCGQEELMSVCDPEPMLHLLWVFFLRRCSDPFKATWNQISWGPKSCAGADKMKGLNAEFRNCSSWNSSTVWKTEKYHKEAQDTCALFAYNIISILWYFNNPEVYKMRNIWIQVVGAKDYIFFLFKSSSKDWRQWS